MTAAQPAQPALPGLGAGRCPACGWTWAWHDDEVCEAVLDAVAAPARSRRRRVVETVSVSGGRL